jgi:hypothetical protein
VSRKQGSGRHGKTARRRGRPGAWREDTAPRGGGPQQWAAYLRGRPASGEVSDTGGARHMPEEGKQAV